MRVLLSHIAARTSVIRLFAAPRLFDPFRPGTAFCSLEDAIARSSLLVGSPAQIIDKVLRYHGQLGHQVLQLPADAGHRHPGSCLTGNLHTVSTWPPHDLPAGCVRCVVRADDESGGDDDARTTARF
jgi:hypothetical protein